MEFVPSSIRLPQPMTQPPAPRIPIAAAIAPVLVSLGLFAVTGSPLTLLFAVLGPVTAVAGLVDGTIGARRHRRRERRRFDREADEALEAIATAHAAEVAALAATTPAGATIAATDPRAAVRWRSPSSPVMVALGDGEAASSTRVEGGGSPELVELVDAAGRLTAAPLVVDPRDGIGVVGALPVARAVARGIALQAIAVHGPDRAAITADGPAWSDALAALPHRTRASRPCAADSVLLLEAIDRDGPRQLARIEVAADALDLAASCATIVQLAAVRETGEGSIGASGATVRRAGRPGAHAVRVRPLDAVAFRRWCTAAGSVPTGTAEIGAPPEAVGLADLLPARPTGAVAAVIGVGADGPISIDLEREGPHAVVGGTTGSGKSELLLTWIAAMAAGASPSELAVLLVDFKGGAGFAPIAHLPHVVGIVTDLDEAGAMRAVGSLRAELRRREAAIADAGLREHGPGSGLPRLVIVVDEYAALVDADPALHAVFGDLAARGRSLGIHLVVGTQRPSASVRDAVLANADVRVCLRVRDRADAVALVGTGMPAELPAEPRGRALVSAAGAAPALVQVATVDAETIERIRARWAAAARPARPWRDPLPERVTVDALPGLLDDTADIMAASGGVIGVIDRPDLQRIDAWRWHPRRDGMLAAIGAAGCGRSGLIEAIAAVGPSLRVPLDAAGAWDAVHDLAGVDGDHGGLTLLVDDLDLIVDGFEPEHRQAWLERLVLLCRRRRELGLGVVVTAASSDGPMRLLEPHAAVRVLMRMPSRQDHRMAGGDAATWDARLPPGGALVDGHRAQVLAVDPAPSAVIEPRRRRLRARTIAVITADPAAVARRLDRAGRAVLGVPEGLAGMAAGGLPPSAAVVGDAAAWQARWDAVELATAHADVLVHGLAITQLRAVTARRELPPPLPEGDDWCWMLAPGRVLRARLP